MLHDIQNFYSDKKEFTFLNYFGDPNITRSNLLLPVDANLDISFTTI